MNSPATPWDDDYRARGRLWGGALPPLPGLLPGSRVLDLGCGDGRALPAMAGRGWEIIAADIAPYAMRLCRNASPSAAVSCIVADGRSLPFRDRSFDGVLAWHVLGHVVKPDRDRMAGEILRVLRPEGTLFFRGFAVGDMRYGKGREIEPGTFRRGNGIATHYFTEPEIRMLFPGFSRHTLRTEQWILRVRGSTLLRTEIAGTFTKGDEE